MMQFPVEAEAWNKTGSQALPGNPLFARLCLADLFGYASI